jgi:hypothetical protein
LINTTLTNYLLRIENERINMEDRFRTRIRTATMRLRALMCGGGSAPPEEAIIDSGLHLSWAIAPSLSRAHRKVIDVPQIGRLSRNQIAYCSLPTLCLSLAFCLVSAGAFAYGQTQSQIASKVQKENKAIMTRHATGTFEVKMTPQASDEKGAGPAVGRYSLDKHFHGDLEGTSQGEMLAVGTAVEGSAGYVAMEQVTGTLGGRKGTFALQHTGTMTRGAPQLSVAVVPDSGTGQLVGLTGRMDIKITDGKHFYDFEYSIAEVP